MEAVCFAEGLISPTAFRASRMRASAISVVEDELKLHSEEPDSSTEISEEPQKTTSFFRAFPHPSLVHRRVGKPTTFISPFVYAAFVRIARSTLSRTNQMKTRFNPLKIF